VDEDILRKAFQATSKKRGTIGMIGQLSVILENIELNGIMQREWENYKRNSFFVGDLSWDEVMISVKELAVKACDI
jgi:hypothetical protein